ncbi:MAG: [FeFe] hydrogenase, group A [Coriobacteriales bacterium]|jgi:NADH-quinone oxidoreductase subunit G|nr:[FeFe] hydrogenase, group A [Coriobacteriales bacterium]
MVKQVNLTINGIEVSAPETMTILAAANKAGIIIPTLCFAWNLNDVGSCRVCVVEVEGAEQLVSACNNLVAEGMVVRTNTPKVRRTRKLNVELLLSQHDVQCTQCVRSGSCELQTLANDLNILDVRFPKQVEPYDWNSDFPLIRDAGKCIKCLRCVQTCDKVQATSVWDLKNRATRSTVGVAQAAPIAESLCALCGQCITHCPTGALRERDDIDAVFEALADPDKITVVQIAPSVRTSWGEPLGLTHEEASVKRLVAALRKMGFDYIFDTDFSADLTIMEEGSEFVKKFGERERHAWPMFTSCCPGWVRWIKGHYPQLTDQLSTAKSPQQMFGAIEKSYHAELIGVDPERIFSLSLMPCLAKKHECAIPGMDDAGAGPDVDVVLTVREVDRLIRAEHIDVKNIAEEDFDTPLGIGTGAGEIFGATGGVMEAALRSAYFLVTGSNPDPDAFAQIRGVEGWKEATFDLAGTPVRVAVASGLGNAEKLLRALEAGEVQYDFVEIMACPGGCVGGGGQPISELHNVTTVRGKILYGLDSMNEYRFSHENPSITAVYRDYLGAPLSERAHHLLHTDHQAWSMPNERRDVPQG